MVNLNNRRCKMAEHMRVEMKLEKVFKPDNVDKKLYRIKAYCFDYEGIPDFWGALPPEYLTGKPKVWDPINNPEEANVEIETLNGKKYHLEEDREYTPRELEEMIAAITKAIERYEEIYKKHEEEEKWEGTLEIEI